MENLPVAKLPNAISNVCNCIFSTVRPKAHVLSQVNPFYNPSPYLSKEIHPHTSAAHPEYFLGGRGLTLRLYIIYA
jgi:hypothetical protein